VTALAARAPLPSLARIEGWLHAQAEQRELAVSDGRVETVRERGGGTWAYEYDERGDLVALHDPLAGTTRMRYDGARRLTELIEPGGVTTSCAYDAGGALAVLRAGDHETRFERDAAGRLVRRHATGADTAVYRYDEHGRLASARTSSIETEYEYDTSGRLAATAQTRNGARIEARFTYDERGRLATLVPPGSARAIAYRWDAADRPTEVRIGERATIAFAFDRAAGTARTVFPNGVETLVHADPADGRVLRTRTARGGETLFAESFAYAPSGAIASDGERDYAYDVLGRLVRAGDGELAYDAHGNLVATAEDERAYDAHDRLLTVTARGAATADGGAETFEHDARGRLARRRGARAEWTYRYDGADNLVEVLRDAARVAAFEYDHDGRLARAQTAAGAERYLYDAAGALLAIADDDGTPRALIVRTPLGVLAEIRGRLDDGEIAFHHTDRRGSTRAVTAANGTVLARHEYAPFGAPRTVTADAGDGRAAHPPSYTGNRWYAEIGLYRFAGRWYDPDLARFLTPDTYTARPDDARLLNPAFTGREQTASRALLLDDWLRRPRLRNRYAYCGNDPIGSTDPDGHWSFGGFVLSLLGAIWTLPNTLIALVIEILVLIGEVIRWIVFVVTIGHVSWPTPGFDAAASPRLNAFALVFRGGWFGSLNLFTGMTIGNVIFVDSDWENDPRILGQPDVQPPPYNGTVTLTRREAFYEHELRHTNQYGWLGPFFLLGMPLWGFYFWDLIVNGYDNSILEKDAARYAGFGAHGAVLS
jgi:RHS repeat-associated protein